MCKWFPAYLPLFIPLTRCYRLLYLYPHCRLTSSFVVTHCHPSSSSCQYHILVPISSIPFDWWHTVRSLSRGTSQVARDMLAIVKAHNSEKLQYWGFSYGSLLGATFAAMFPVGDGCDGTRLWRRSDYDAVGQRRSYRSRWSAPVFVPRA